MRKNPNPLVTIITPTYNRAEFLQQTIDSVLAQTYKPIEHIVLDDGSLDNTPEILASYQNEIKWVSHSNMGETLTVNKGWGMASGEFIINVNSDDPILPDLVSAGVDFMQQHPHVVAAYPDWYLIDKDSNTTQEMKTLDFSHVNMVKWHHCFPGPGVLIRKSAIDAVGPRNPAYRYTADYEFWLRLALYGPLARIPKTLATWRNHDGCLTNSARGIQMAEEHVRLMDEYFARTDLPPDIVNVRDEAFQAACYIAAILVSPVCRATARKYYIRSMACRPLRGFNYPTGLKFSLPEMAPTFFPKITHRPGNFLYRLARRAFRTCRSATQFFSPITSR